MRCATAIFYLERKNYMANIFAPGGYELATKSMIPGNGINLLDGTKDVSTFGFSTSGNGEINKLNDPALGSQPKSLSALTDIVHAWGTSEKSAIIKYNKPLNLVPGNYTLSFIACGNDPNNSTTPLLSAFNGSTVLGTANTKLLYQKTFIAITFQVTNTDPINLTIGNDSNDLLPSGSIWYANFKLEAGVNPTPWSESPADQIQELKSELQAK